MLSSIGGHGEQLDIEALRTQWQTIGRYRVVPENVPGLLFALTLAAKNNVRTPEELQECLTKMSEVVEAVWSMKGPPQEVDFVPYGKAVIMVNKAIGE